MRTTLLIALLCVSYNLSAQFFAQGDLTLTKERLPQTTTYIAKTDDKQYDSNLKNGFDDFWELTDVKYVNSLDDLDLEDESNSYFIPLTKTVSDGMSTQKYPYLALVVGGKEDLTQRIVASLTLDNFGSEKMAVEAGYRAYNFANMMQDFIEMKIEFSELPKNPVKQNLLFTSKINDRSKVIKTKTLLVAEESLSTGKYFPFKSPKQISQRDFKKYYPGNVKFVNKETIEDAINNRDPNFCYLQTNAMRSKYVYIVDCEESKVVFKILNSYHFIIRKKDLKTMKKIILN